MCRFKAHCLLLFILFIPLSLTGQELQIELHQLKELAEQYSAEWQQIDNQLDYSIQGERVSATRLNPSLAYNLEFLDDGTYSEYEHQLYLQKEFRTPGYFRNLRERRDSRTNLYEYQSESVRAEWLASTRFGFIRIVLAKQEIEQLRFLISHLNRLATASARRTDEGEESAIDNQLIQMSRYVLKTRIEEVELEAEFLETNWRNRMGFDVQDEIHYDGDFRKPDIQLPEVAELLTLLNETPQMNAYRMAVETAEVEESFARSSRLSTFELTAGYKHLNPDFQGFLVGIAIPIPILNSGSEAISRARMLNRIEQTNLNQARIERNQNLYRVLNSLQHYEVILNQFPDHLSQPDQFINSISISYEEGTLSLNDFLNTLSLMADTYQSKFNQLTGYYSMITELETLAGREFINQ